MTVRELIKELEQLPMDLPVVNDLQEITDTEIEDVLYYLDNSSYGYSYYPAVVLR